MARELETKGVKSVLCTRLQEALNAEKSKEEGVEPKVSSLYHVNRFAASDW